MERKILFVMPRFPFPPASGRKTSLYHYCRILTTKLGYQLIVAAFPEDGDTPALKPDFIDRLIVLPMPSKKERIVNLAVMTFIRRKIPIQASLFLSKKAQSVIDQIVVEEAPDILIADMVRSTEYLKNYDCIKIADLDDLLSLRYQRQMENDLDGINPYGAFITKFPVFFQKLLSTRVLKKAIVRLEINLLKNYEQEIGRYFDKTIFVAHREAEQLNQIIKKEKAASVPTGVDIDYFSCKFPEIKLETNWIGFLGAMNVAHNEHAVCHFIEDILPYITEKIPDATFMIVGGGVGEKLLQYASRHVVFTGRVDDVRIYLQKCSVFVCPMTFGSGIKTKNLEAMAMKIPIVTTSIGAENILANDRSEWRVEDDNKKFADAVIDIIKYPENYQAMTDAAFQFVENNFSWKTAEKCFLEIFNTL